MMTSDSQMDLFGAPAEDVTPPSAEVVPFPGTPRPPAPPAVPVSEIGEPLFATAPAYRYHYDDDDVARLFDRPLLRALVASKAFQRLKDISFLGAIDHLFHPNGQPGNVRHSRYDHSLGVGLLAMRYCSVIGLDDTDRDLLGAAALLHDIGHGPLSHTLEPEFARRFNVNHHQATQQIVLGRDDAVAELSVRKLLIDHRVDPMEVVQLLIKRSAHPHGALFAGPLNIDTLEGISRSKTYFHRGVVHCHPELLIEAAASPDDAALRRLDGFWKLKEEVYQTLIFNPKCFAGDHLCRRFIADHLPDLTAADFLLTETAFLRRHREFSRFLYGLRRRIELHGAAEVLLDAANDTAPVPQRRFLINRRTRVRRFADLSKRYREEKGVVHRRIGKLAEGERRAQEALLFDL